MRTEIAATAVSRSYLAVAFGLPFQFLTELALRRDGTFADDTVSDAAVRYLGGALLGVFGYLVSRFVPAAKRFPFWQGNIIAFAVSSMLGRAAHHAGGAESPYVVSLCTVLFCWSLIMPGGARFSVVPIIGSLVSFYGTLVASRGHLDLGVRGSAFALFTTTSAFFAVDYAEVLERWRREVSMSSSTDALTRLSNRAALLARFESLHDDARTHPRAMSVLMVDLDHFKSVNDTYGHAVGDEVLRTVADVLVRATRKDDACGRVGGEEFVLVLDACDEHQAVEVAERIRESIAATRFEAGGNVFHVTASLGVACVSAGGQASPRDLMGRADTALYESKTAGRNRVTVARA